jgi:ribosomal-protein-serine acetyltransferase
MIAEIPAPEITIDDCLVLKRLRIDTAALIFKIIHDDREHLRQWLPFVDDTRKPEDTEIFIKSILHTSCVKKDLIYEIWYHGELAGLIALKEIDRGNKKTELGYWIISKFERLGLITKSCRALIEISFKQLGMKRIQLKAAIGNARSSLVAERLNFKLEGIERAGELHHQKYFDLIVYSLLKKDWNNRG